MILIFEGKGRRGKEFHFRSPNEEMKARGTGKLSHHIWRFTRYQ